MNTPAIILQALLDLWEDLPGWVGPDWPALAGKISALVTAIQASGDADERALMTTDLLSLFRPYDAARSQLRARIQQVERERGVAYRGESKSPQPHLPGLDVLLAQMQALLARQSWESLDYSTPQDAKAAPLYEILRIDAAVPKRVVVAEVFTLAVSIRQQTSPVLREKELKVVRSGLAEVEFDDPNAPIRLRLRVSAPTCAIEGEGDRSFRLRHGEDSTVFYFLLTPQREGVIRIVVYLFQEEDLLGNAPLQTQAAPVVPAGKVELHLTSVPLPARSDAELKRQVEAKERKLSEARGYLDAMERQLDGIGPGLTRAEVEHAIDKQRQLIREIEGAIDRLMA